MFKLLFLVLLLRFPTNFIESADDYGFAANQAYIEAIKAFRKKQYSDSAKLFKEAARRGHPEAYYFLGRMVEVGYGYKKNQKRAYYLYKKGLENGSKRARLRIKQIRNARKRKSNPNSFSKRILPEWEMEEEGIHLTDIVDNLEDNPKPSRMEDLPSLFSLKDEKNVGKNLPPLSTIQSEFINSVNFYGKDLSYKTWFEICNMKAFQISWFDRFERSNMVCGPKAESYWKTKTLIKNKKLVSEIYSEMQKALKTDISDNHKVELLARYSSLIDKSAARHYLGRAFDKLTTSREGLEAIEAMVHALGRHKRSNETLEIMDFGKDFYASAYFQSAISFLDNNEIARAQVIYKKSGGKLGYHSSRPLAFQYNWKLYKLNYHKRAMHQFKKLMIHSESFVPSDWFAMANLLQDDHIFRKDAQIAFEKCLRWEPVEKLYGDILVSARAYQQKSIELWGIEGPLGRYKEMEE